MHWLLVFVLTYLAVGAFFKLYDADCGKRRRD